MLRRLLAQIRARPAAAAAAAPAPSPALVVPVLAEPVRAPDEEPTLRLGEMHSRLGHPVPGLLLRELGITPALKVGPHPVYWESDWNRICAAVAANSLGKMRPAPGQEQQP